MTTETKSRPTKTEPARKTLVADRLEKLKVADEILIEAALRQEPIADADMDFLASLGFSSDANTLYSETSRCNLVARHMNNALTTADRQQNQADLAAARQRVADEVPALDHQISELQAQLATVQTERDALTNEVQRHEADAERMAEGQAALRNRELLPPHLRLVFNERYKEFNAEFRHPIGVAQARLNSIREIIALPLAMAKDHCHLKRDLGLIDARGNFDEQGWQRYCNKLQIEAIELKKEIADRQPDHDTAKEKLEKIFDYPPRIYDHQGWGLL